jgi:hypothetical protein
MALSEADKQYIRALVAKAVRAAVAEAKAEIYARLRDRPLAGFFVSWAGRAVARIAITLGAVAVVVVGNRTCFPWSSLRDKGSGGPGVVGFQGKTQDGPQLFLGHPRRRRVPDLFAGAPWQKARQTQNTQH